jgi:hypothetical protein
MRVRYCGGVFATHRPLVRPGALADAAEPAEAEVVCEGVGHQAPQQGVPQGVGAPGIRHEPQQALPAVRSGGGGGWALNKMANNLVVLFDSMLANHYPRGKVHCWGLSRAQPNA